MRAVRIAEPRSTPGQGIRAIHGFGRAGGGREAQIEARARALEASCARPLETGSKF